MFSHISFLPRNIILQRKNKISTTIKRFYGLSIEQSVVCNLMLQHQVIPDVLERSPCGLCNVIYPQCVKVCQGNELKPYQVRCQPTMEWKSDKKDFYTMCMIDPDAPSRIAPQYREKLHWLVGNIPGHKVKQADCLAEYIGPGPSEGTSFHRYIFLVYEQSKKISFNERLLICSSHEGRYNFSICKFAKKYGLGTSFAGNLFLAKWDCTVPKLPRPMASQKEYFYKD